MVVETTQLETDAKDLKADARTFLVETADDYEGGAELLLLVKDYRKRLDDTFDPIIKAAHKTHKEALSQKKKHDKPAADAEDEIKLKMIAWKNVEEARIAQEHRAAEEAERKRAEEEKLAEAEAAEAAGHKAEAEAILERETVTMPVARRAAAPKVDGISVRKRWTFEVVDVAKVPRAFCSIDEKKLRKFATTMGAEASVPGVRFYETESMAAGR